MASMGLEGFLEEEERAMDDVETPNYLRCDLYHTSIIRLLKMLSTAPVFFPPFIFSAGFDLN
ncbi:MAG: hypothetical protein V1845_00665 [bacterium]